MPRLEFIGKDFIRRDPMAFLEKVRRDNPHLSERGLHEVAGREFEKRKPRHASYVQHLFGEDILTTDLEQIEAWQWITPAFRRIVSTASMKRRRELVDPKGLSKTYVWRKSNGWVQDVTEADVEVLRHSGARTWFRDIDQHGVWEPKRAWDYPVAERFEATSLDEGERFVADVTRKKQWNGV